MKRDPTRQMAARLQAQAGDLLKACFPELPDGVNIPAMLFIETGTPNIPFSKQCHFTLTTYHHWLSSVHLLGQERKVNNLSLMNP